MKCISLWQPWASLMVVGSKKIETRHWPTRHKGPLLIHAAKKPFRSIEPFIAEPWLLRNGLATILDSAIPQWWELLPYGAIVGKVEMVDCKRVELIDRNQIHKARVARPEDANRLDLWFTEFYLGNYEPGRFGWLTDEPKRLSEPIAYRGRQGLFDVPDELLESANWIEGIKF